MYVFSNKHFIAPVKINIIFIYRCTGKPLNSQLNCSITPELFYQTQKFILNKNGDTEKTCHCHSVEEMEANIVVNSLSLSLYLSLSLSLSLSLNLIHISVKYLENSITCPGAGPEIFQRGRLKIIFFF